MIAPLIHQSLTFLKPVRALIGTDDTGIDCVAQGALFHFEWCVRLLFGPCSKSRSKAVRAGLEAFAPHHR